VFVPGFGTINVWTDRTSYRVGDTITVSFDTGGGGISASARIDITGPASLTWGPFSLVTGGVYTARLSGATPFPGNYYLKVTLGLTYDVYEGTTVYQVVQAVPFDYSMTVSPPSVTVKKGETANYDVTVKYSDSSYSGTTISVDVSGLGPGMTYTLSKDGALSVLTSDATPAGTYTIKLTGSARSVTHVVTATLVVEELKAVLTYVSVSGIPTFGSPIYVGENSKTVAVISNTGNAMARGVRLVLEEIAPTSGLTVTGTDPSQDIAPLGTGQWTIDVRGDLPGSYKGFLRVYVGNDRVLEQDWKLDVLGPEISVSAIESQAQEGSVHPGDIFTVTYTLKNTSPVDADNVSIDLTASDGLTILQKPSIASIPAQSEVKAQIKLRSVRAGTEWLKIAVSSYGTVVYEDTLDFTISERPLWEQQSFMLAVVVGAVLVAAVVLVMRQRKRKTPSQVMATPKPLSEPTSLCPRCGKQLTYVQAQSRWYCTKCREYV
jgi:ribosomal protein S27AE